MNNFINRNQTNHQLLPKGIFTMKLPKTFFALFVACALLFIACPAWAQVEASDLPQPEARYYNDHQDHRPLPTGAWEVFGNTKLQGDFKALLTFSGDGIVLADEHGGAFETTGHGNWKRIGYRSFAYTFIAYIGSANSELTAVIKVSGTLTLSRDLNRWEGPFTLDVLDPKGNKIFTDDGTFQSKRIGIEVRY